MYKNINMTIKIDSQLPNYAIVHNFSRTPKRSTMYYWNCDPFALFRTYTKQESLTQAFEECATNEASLYVSRDQQNFRESAATQPNVPNIGTQPRQFSQTEKGKDQSGNDLISLLTRVRLYASAPVATIINISCFIIATSPKRDELLNLINDGDIIPNILSQYTQKIRISDGKGVRVAIGKTIVSNELFKTLFKDTFFDIEFLRSTRGFAAFKSFCQWCYSHPGNYVAFTVVDSTNKSKVFSRLEGGEQATFTAINTASDKKSDVLLASIQLLPFNCYQENKVKDVNISDAQLFGCFLSGDAEAEQPIPMLSILTEYTSDLSSSKNASFYLVYRASGTIINDSGFESESFEVEPSAQRSSAPKGKQINGKGNNQSVKPNQFSQTGNLFKKENYFLVLRVIKGLSKSKIKSDFSKILSDFMKAFTSEDISRLFT